MFNINIMNKVILTFAFVLVLFSVASPQYFSQRYGWYDGQPCHVSCYRCYWGYDPNSCYDCYPGMNRYQNYYDCPCYTGYYEVGSQMCPQCSRQCYSCSGSASNCGSCQSYRTNAPTCSCISRYYDDGYSAACQPCQYTCASCTGPSQCDTCSASYKRQLSSTTSYCICFNRYYDAGYQQCYSCDPTCFTCSGSSSTQCLSCNTTAFRVLSGSTCICANGYYATSTSIELCSICQYSCLTCNGGYYYNCLSCNTTMNRALSSGQCPCKTGYFQNSSLLCQVCQSSCYTCVNSYECTSCVASSLKTINSSNLCSCTSTQFLSGSVCASCNYKCLTCVTAATTCTSCSPTSNRIYLSNTCNCLPYYYDPGSVVCLPCMYKCKTCTTSTTCATCDASLNRTLSGGTCICNAGLYDDGSNAVCKPCLYSCATCSNSSSCTTCNATLNRVLTSGQCLCKPYYYQNQTTLTCGPCLYSCLTCINNYSCITCNSTLYRVYSSTACVCQSGYYQTSSLLCSPCSSTCLTCANTSTFCTSCKPNLHLLLNATSGICYCDPVYPLNPLNNLCQQCLYGCATCSININCSTCNASSYRIMNTSTGFCDCMDGYYDDGVNQQCPACYFSCLTCVGSSTNCTSCTPGSLRSLTTATAGVSHVCSCPQHYFDTAPLFVYIVNCQPCQYTCSSCSANTSCSTCNSSNFRSFDTHNVFCICGVGYYDDGSNQLCATCQYSCATCTNSSECSTCPIHRDIPSSGCPCVNGYYDQMNGSPVCLSCHYSCSTCLNNSACIQCESSYNRVSNGTTKLCSCKSGYFNMGTNPVCLACDSTCVTCSNASTCLSCNATLNRTLMSGSCQCLVGYYPNASACSPCNYKCATCVGENSCATCNTTSKRAYNSTTYYCQCIIGYYQMSVPTAVCPQCNLTCLSCTNATACASCDILRGRILNSTANYAGVVDNMCPCQYGYYSLGLNLSCAACHFTCSYCSGPNKTNCLACQSASHRVLTASSCVCPVTLSLFDPNTTLDCLPCNIACATCWNSMNTTCFTCSAGDYFMMVGMSTCYDICPLWYWNDAGGGYVCTLCGTGCWKCTSTNICTQCSTNLFLFHLNTSCIPTCPPLLYYGNTTTKSCQPCPSGCQTCNSSTACQSCLSSLYYLDALILLCFKCSSSCLECYGPADIQCSACVYPLVLQDGKCISLNCSYGMYVDQAGCQPCATKWNNSLTCVVSSALTCKTGYMVKAGIPGGCFSCQNVVGYYTNKNGGCSQVCGDGIRINYQCDDGNTLDGDGCSSNCMIQSGWVCVGGSSTPTSCSLTEDVTMSLASANKLRGVNQAVMHISLSLPILLSPSYFTLTISTLSPSSYSYTFNQTKGQLTDVIVLISYLQAIEGKLISISYTQSRRLLVETVGGEQQRGQHSEQHTQQHTPTTSTSRLLMTASFAASIQFSTFPPSEYISADTSHMFSTIAIAMKYLSLALLLVSLLLVYNYHLHAIYFFSLPMYLYQIYFVAAYQYTEWIAVQTASINWGQGGWQPKDDQTISPSGYSIYILANSAYIIIGIVFLWIVYGISKVLVKDRTDKCSISVYYYVLTLQVLLHMYLPFSAVLPLLNSEKSLLSLQAALNLALAIFVSMVELFAIAALWYLVKSASREKGREIQSAATASIKGEGSDNDAAGDYSKSNTSQQNQQYSHQIQKSKGWNLYAATSTSQIRTSTPTATEQNHSSIQPNPNPTAPTLQQLFPQDYSSEYKNKSAAPYFLPILLTRIYLSSILSAVFAYYFPSHTFWMMLGMIGINLAFIIWMVKVKPFATNSTNYAYIGGEIIITGCNAVFAGYLYYAQANIYSYTLEIVVVVYLIVMVGVFTVGCLIYRIKSVLGFISKVLEPCLFRLRLAGAPKVYDIDQDGQNQNKGKDQPKPQTIQVQQLKQTSQDAFYARVLMKKQVNEHWQIQRRGRRRVNEEIQ